MQSRHRVAALFLVVAFSWSLILIALAVREWHHQSENSQALAHQEAKAAYHKDIAYRQWATHHGGVYVPISESTPPNPNLAHLSHRDVNTTDGQQLTLVNPAYMTRQVHELPETQYGIKGKLTSLQPLRAENAPDHWEARALEAVQATARSFWELATYDGAPHLRFMGPMQANQNCLICHHAQGYAVGDIIGGVSIMVPWTPYQALLDRSREQIVMGYGALWLFGVLALGGMFVLLEREERARKQAHAAIEKSEEGLRRAQQMAKIGNWELDLVRNRLEWSEEIFTIFGIDPSRFKASYEAFLAAIHPDDRAKVDEAYQNALKSREPYRIEHRLQMPDGQIKWVREECESEFAPDGTPLISRGTVQDITREKSLRDALEALNETLERRIEQEVARRRRSERVMIQQSRVAAMGEMITAVAHHWRQPLSVVALTIQSLRDEYEAGELDARRLEEMIALSMDKIHEMSEAIDALRGVAQASAEREECCLLIQAQEAYGILRSEFEAAGIEVMGRCFGGDPVPFGQCRCNPANARVRMIASEFRQVVFNLLSNARDAIRLSDQKKGRITVTIEFDGDVEQLIIEDNGGGIPPEVMEHLFEPFYTTKERGQGSGAVTGVGLGLYLAKMIIEERMGGTIRAENGDEGARMIIRLPTEPS